MPDRPPNCRTTEIACTFSEMHALSPKLAENRRILENDTPSDTTHTEFTVQVQEFTG